jgi:hypothetical protein
MNIRINWKSMKKIHNFFSFVVHLCFIPKVQLMWVVATLLCFKNYVHNLKGWTWVVWSYWIACKLSMIVSVFMTSTKMVGIFSLFSKLFQFGGGAHLNSLCMLAWCVILFNNNQQSMKLNVAFLGCCVKGRLMLSL